jgi:hypothetical protein
MWNEEVSAQFQVLSDYLSGRMEIVWSLTQVSHRFRFWDWNLEIPKSEAGVLLIDRDIRWRINNKCA